MPREMLSPIADHKEYLPPTQSQKPNIFAGSIPKSFTFGSLVLRATKCLATAAGCRLETSIYHLDTDQLTHIFSISQEPVLGGRGIGDGLLSGESLGRDNKKHRFGVHFS